MLGEEGAEAFFQAFALGPRHGPGVVARPIHLDEPVGSHVGLGHVRHGGLQARDSRGSAAQSVRHPTVSAAPDLPGRAGARSGARPRAGPPCELTRAGDQGGELTLLKRNVHRLPLPPRRARPQRQQNAECGFGTGMHVGARQAAHHRRAIRVAAHARVAPHSDTDEVMAVEVSIRARLPEGADGADHQAGMVRGQPGHQGFGAQPPGLQTTRPARIEHDIRRTDQCHKGCPVGLGVGQIQNHAALPRIAGQPGQARGQSAVGRIGVRRPTTQRVAARRFDLDDVRPKVGEDSPGQMAAFIAQVEYPVVGEQSQGFLADGAGIGWGCGARSGQSVVQS